MTGVNTTTEDLKFSLYPVTSESTVGATVVDPKSNETVTYSIYHLKENTDMGFRVQTPTCWKKVVELFHESAKQVETITIQMSEGKTENVPVIGSIVW